MVHTSFKIFKRVLYAQILLKIKLQKSKQQTIDKTIENYLCNLAVDEDVCM